MARRRRKHNPYAKASPDLYSDDDLFDFAVDTVHFIEKNKKDKSFQTLYNIRKAYVFEFARRCYVSKKLTPQEYETLKLQISSDSTDMYIACKCLIFKYRS